MTLFILHGMPERARYIAPIRQQIPGLIIVWDRTRNAQDTFRAALAAAGDEAAVHLEDDVVLTSDFLAKITPHLKDYPVSFFSRTTKDDKAIGSRWRPGASFSMTQCVYLPAGMSKAVHDYYPTWPGLSLHKGGTDLMLGDFFKTNGLRYWQHVPSLVQHGDARSMIDPTRSKARQSATFVP